MAVASVRILTERQMLHLDYLSFLFLSSGLCSNALVLFMAFMLFSLRCVLDKQWFCEERFMMHVLQPFVSSIENMYCVAFYVGHLQLCLN